MATVEFCSFGSSSAPAEYNEPEFIILAFCEMKPEGLGGSRWKHMGARCWQCCGHQSVVRSLRGAAGQGDGAPAVSQPAQNPEKLLWFCLSFLGLWMESSLPTSQRVSRSCLQGQALTILLRERELTASSMLPAQDLCMQ